MKVSCICKEESESGKVLENSLVFENNAFVEAFNMKT
jgi:hypothetical protein